MIRAIVLLLWTSFCVAGVMEKQFLTYSEANQIWNMEPFNSVQFKTLKPDDRGGMALDMINRGIFNNKKMVEVKKELGNPDGHYAIRNSLAYQLGSDDKNSYQLIFLPDFSGKAVENVKIEHQPIETVMAPAPAKSGISAGPKRLPIDIDGPLAASMYKHLSGVSEVKGIKAGKNISCSKSGAKYHCSLEIDEQGTATAK